ncbi:spore coat protein [Lutispora thermophila]|uniref:Coat F domain-containing protein n=1 Tax=Lutispora thermophila DSM 19022 TaxID=1122184 RepID=A0A1M6GD81_9FIRM|nr:spore coat protein [Lutispora thermophila]SHJ07850.1 Coat F domain-containing protein [Lutispora thermophila DSM 19022]
MNNNPQLTDQDIMNDLLAMEKQIASAYNTGITEASCQNLRKTLTDNLLDTQQLQYTIFDTMKRKGWYQTKDAQDQDVNNAKSKYTNIKNEL